MLEGCKVGAAPIEIYDGGHWITSTAYPTFQNCNVKFNSHSLSLIAWLEWEDNTWVLSTSRRNYYHVVTVLTVSMVQSLMTKDVSYNTWA